MIETSLDVVKGAPIMQDPRFDETESSEYSIASYSTPPKDVPNIEELAARLVASAKGGGLALTGADGLLTGLTRQVLQKALEVEMAEHLGYEHNDRSVSAPENYRNGSSQKREIYYIEKGCQWKYESLHEPVDKKWEELNETKI